MVCLNKKLKCSFTTLVYSLSIVFKYIIINLYNLHIIFDFDFFFCVY